jgi:hypothetical protein
MTLTEFILARLDEDEAAVKALRVVVDPGTYLSSGIERPTELDAATAAHCDRYYPRRVLAEVAAKRAIMEIHYNGAPEHYTERCSLCDTVNEPCRTVLALAIPYADHADYDEAWRP